MCQPNKRLRRFLTGCYPQRFDKEQEGRKQRAGMTEWRLLPNPRQRQADVNAKVRSDGKPFMVKEAP
jgi:hypothetical protein